MPDGPLWAVLMLWSVAYMFGFVFENNRFVKIPGLLGHLLAGLVLRNLPGDEQFLNIPESWGTKIKVYL